MDNKEDNNNSFSNLDQSFNFDDMKELGVNMLPDMQTTISEKKKRDRSFLFPENVVYNDHSAVEAIDYEATQKVKYIKADKILYRQKQKPLTISKDIFSSLSDEIILGVLKFLSHEDLKYVAQVNHRFRRLSEDDSLWPRLDLANKILSSDSLAYILKRGVQVLRLKETKVNSPIWHDHLGNKLKSSRLKYLDMSYCLISPCDLALLLSVCRNLKKLSLEGCQVSIDVCKEIGNNHMLDTLNLAMVEDLNSEGVGLICKGCTRLQAVNLSWTKLDKESVITFVNTISSNLQKLNLSGLNFSVDDSCIATLVKRCPGINELDISDCLEVTSLSLFVMAEALPNLLSLGITRCHKIDPRKVIEVLEKMNNLRSLTVFRIIGSNDAKALEARYSLLRVNKEFFSTIARPTVGVRRTSIWLNRCRE